MMIDKTQLVPLSTHRQTENPVNPLFVNRWSPRALSHEKINQAELMKIFEAARWAPSSYNNQPWRFIFGIRETSAWTTLFHLLNEHNQSWAKEAAVLLLVISKRTFDNGKPSPTHSFDTGSAWMSMALQASMDGWVVHGMEGFDHAKARKVFAISEEYEVEAMSAIGRPGRKEDLPAPLQAKEFPSDRKKISELIFEGTFKETIY